MSERQFQLELNDWFSPKIEYEGWGIAEFSNPEGRIEGKAQVVYDEFENADVRMNVEKLCIKGIGLCALSHLYDFFKGKVNVNSSGMQIRGWPLDHKNRCQKLIVATDEGRYSAISLDLDYHVMVPFGNLIQFDPTLAEFSTNTVSKQLHFVLPLANYIGSNIQFDYFVGTARIRHVADYDGRKQQLEKRQADALITAILEGELNSTGVQLDHWKEFFPVDLTRWISVATGRNVGIPWIEFRDYSGGLVRRIHAHYAKSIFRRGLAMLNVDSDIAQLLSHAVKKNLPYGERMHLNAAISQLVLGGYFNNDGNVEDRLSHLFRAIDSLWHSQKGKPKPASVLSLSTIQQVEKIIDNARAEIDKLRSSFQRNSKQANALHRLQQLLNIDVDPSKKFSSKLLELLDMYSLNDAKVLDTYYQTHVKGKSGTWLDNVNKHRNDIMHEGWFNWRDDSPDINELRAFVYHLHDIAVRVLLKTFGYNGHYTQYTPSTNRLRQSRRSVEWVQPSTTPAELGYYLT